MLSSEVVKFVLAGDGGLENKDIPTHPVFINMYRPPGRLIRSFGYILLDFWPQNWSGWLRTALRIHLDQVSDQTIDSRPNSRHFR